MTSTRPARASTTGASMPDARPTRRRLATPSAVAVAAAAAALLGSLAGAPRTHAQMDLAASGGGDATATPRVALSDNLRPAGRLEGGVLTLRLEARNGTWYPEGPDGVGLPVAAFAEEGYMPQNPGPLVRVPAGTEVRITVRNALAKPLTIFGLGERRGIAADSFVVEPGAEREARFRATGPGTFYYAGRTTRAPVVARGSEDSQLNGAIVVDPPASATRAPDRVFIVSWWFRLDSTTASGLGPATLAINGRAWPHTERLDVAQGDSLRWRWINLTALDHPMHLHGFYFRVDGVGDGAHYTVYAPDERRRAVTELLGPGRTMAMTWSPNRPGNWVLHCHFVGHISHRLVSLAPARTAPPVAGQVVANGHAHDAASAPAAAASHGGHEMAGLVLGIRVAPRGAALARSARKPQRIRVEVRSRPDVYGPGRAGFAYVLGGAAESADADTLPLPGPTLVLEKGRPVAITVVNRSHEPAAVHWHGIELESPSDGVPGWSGSGGSLMPAIAPDDSMIVRFTPPRAGTFMYHSHFDEFEQIASGLYGPIVVLEPGARRDPEADRVLLFSDSGPTTNIIRGPFPPALLNGRARPEPMELRAGTTYRFRLINIRTDYLVAVALLGGEGATAAAEAVRWRPVAKDGAELPAAQATARPARLTFAPGEIHDVEFTPLAPGDLTLQFGHPQLRPTDPKPVSVPVRVR